MIYFDTEHEEMYNHIIHNFLKIEVFDEEDNLESMIEYLLPEYLVREQYQKCEEKFKELYKWTNDKLHHRMSAMHELILYAFLEYMSDFQKHFPYFNNIYFDEKAHKLINKASQKCAKEDPDGDIESYKELFYDILYYPDDLFEDLDFLEVIHLYNLRRRGDFILEERLGINIDYYFELLPLDVQEKYKTTHITLSSEVIDMLSFLQDRIIHGSLTKLFWNNKTTASEKQIQVIIDNLMTAFYHKKDIEILWKSDIKYNNINFIIYKRRDENKQFFLQFQRANKEILKEGYEKKLQDHSRNYKGSYYIILCFTDEEYKIAEEFIDSYVYTEIFTLYLNITIFDLRKKLSASKK